jgi:hypothetical protein
VPRHVLDAALGQSQRGDAFLDDPPASRRPLTGAGCGAGRPRPSTSTGAGPSF